MNPATSWLHQTPASTNNDYRKAAELRQAQLTKPPGALGRLETSAIQLAALQGCEQPCVDNIYIVVFAADHGVVAEGVSAFPQAVTAEMIKNFARGGAAISVLARTLGAKLEVINLGTINALDPLDGVLDLRISSGTANFCKEPAMAEQQLGLAVQAGQQAVDRAINANTQLFIGGEMGIGNTTAAAALACALLEAQPEQLAGPGTGLDSKGVAHKAEVIGRALQQHTQHINSPLEALRRLGGFEIAALTGSYIASAQKGLAVLVDGFICSVAALVASRICPGSEHWFLYSHTSAEPGHQTILSDLNAQPLLDLGMRLGEGSGAAVAVPILRLACSLHNDMATFAEAGVSEKGP